MEYASVCLEDIQHIHKYSACQLLCTLHSVYSILTPFSPGFSPPSEPLKNISRVRYALDKAVRCIQNDIVKTQQADGEVQEILTNMIQLLRQAKADFEVKNVPVSEIK